MKKLAFLLIGVVCVVALFAQTELYIFKTDKTVFGLPVSTIDSILFSNESILTVFKSDKTQAALPISTIDSISVGEVVSDTVTITYAGTSVTVDNPMAKYGVSVTANGADVVVNATVTDNKINYLLKGNSTNGSFKIYSSYRLDLILNGVSLTNSDGPAINIQTKKRCEITLDAGTTNTLTDGTSYASSSEDQKGTFFSEGQLIFKGTGTLTVNGNAKNGIVADDFIEVNGGTLNLNVTPNAAKGLKCSGKLSLNGGVLTVNTIGAATLSATGLGYEPSYCTAIKCDSTISIKGSAITILCTGVGGKGISSDQDIEMTAGTVNVTTSGNGATYTNSLGKTDAYAASCMEADRQIRILGGSVTVISTGTASKGISADGNLTFGDATSGPVVNSTANGTRLLISGTSGTISAVYSVSKAIKSDGLLTINNGTFTVSTNQQDADNVDCDSTLEINGGTLELTLSGNQSKGLKASRNVNLNGGKITLNTSGGVVKEVSGSGYDPSFCTAIKAASDVNLNGSAVIIKSTGVASKGISADGIIAMNNGSVNITMTGNGATYTNSSAATVAYFATGMSADNNITIANGTIDMSISGSAGKGISANKVLTIGTATLIPTLNISTLGAGILLSGSGQNANYAIAKGIKSETAMVIQNGNITVKTSNGTSTSLGGGECLESLAMTINGGNIDLLAADDGINTSKGGETMTGSDGSSLIINGGYVCVSAVVGDAIDSNGNIVMNGGTVVVHGPNGAPEEDIDFNGTCNINGGYIIGGGTNSPMNQAFSAGSTQYAVYATTTTGVTAGTIFHLQDASGTDLVTFNATRKANCYHFSSSALKAGTYTIYTGGTSTGTLKNGLYSGGTYSGGTLKKSFTISGKVTTVAF
jgi:trimeric autotransporter adhesin